MEGSSITCLQLLVARRDHKADWHFAETRTAEVCLDRQYPWQLIYVCESATLNPLDPRELPLPAGAPSGAEGAPLLLPLLRGQRPRVPRRLLQRRGQLQRQPHSHPLAGAHHREGAERYGQYGVAF